MKTINTILLSLTILAGNGCTTTPKFPFLSNYKELGQNVNGGAITISFQDNTKVAGELIAVQADSILLLPTSSNEVVVVPVSTIKHFRLQYANETRSYGGRILLNILLTASHGYLALYTFPINLIVAAIVTESLDKTYTDRIITIRELAMFARFPQGIPPGIDISSIR